MPRLAELGFAEFVSTLLTETAEAVVTAHIQQEARLRDLVESTTLTPAEYAVLMPAVEIDDALASLLPGEEGGTSAVVGGPIPPAQVLDALDLALTRAHTRDDRLTRAGVTIVRLAVGERLAERHLTALREAARFGVPRVVVDGGRVSAKLTYSLFDAGEGPNVDAEEAPPAAVDAGERLEPLIPPRLAIDPRLARIFRVRPELIGRLSAATAGVRLAVRPASADILQDATVRADVFGEISFTFRTVL